MTRFASTSILLALVLAAACSQTPGVDRAGNPPAPPPEVATEMPSPDTVSDPQVGSSDLETEEGPARFEGGVYRIGPKLRDILIGRNWTPGCPVPLHDLRVVIVSYWNFAGEVRKGPLVLHERVAPDVRWVFERLFRARFPIERVDLAAKDRPMRPEDYWNTSRRSVTASFNCRPATGSTSLSHHSYGWAIDINPLQNPYVRGDGSVLRHIAKPFRNRALQRKGMIHDGDIVVRSFARIGWAWGGHWHTLKDYMHFSLTGR
ncbi:MAG: M15 family metallopeptidase [Actinomycetota bacterium]